MSRLRILAVLLAAACSEKPPASGARCDGDGNCETGSYCANQRCVIPPAGGEVSLELPSLVLTAGDVKKLHAASEGGVSWSADGGTIDNDGTYHAPATAGTYHVTATNKNDSSKTATITVTVFAQPATPVITAGSGAGNGFVTESETNLGASVPAGSSGSRHDWTISGGTIATAMPADSIVYDVTASAGGAVTLTCIETNGAGKPGPPGTKTLAVVAAAGTPAITAGSGAGNAFVTTGPTGQGLIASVPSVSGSRHDWTISGGTITTAMPADNILYDVTASAGGMVILDCIETNAAGNPASHVTKTLTVVAAPGTPAITAGLNGNVTLASASNPASVPAVPGMTHSWSIGGTGASIGSAGGDRITFTAASSGNTTLDCKETNQALVSASCVTKILAGVAVPGTPSIAAGSGAGNAFVTTGATGLSASVSAASGSRHDWQISGGAFAGGGTMASGDSVTYNVTANAGGTLALSCSETNAAGTPGTAASKSLSVAAQPGSPIIGAGLNGNVTSGSNGNAASVPTVSGMTHGWLIGGAGASITSSATGDGITFTAATSGNTTLDCTETNQALVSAGCLTRILTGVAAPGTPNIAAGSGAGNAFVTTGATGLSASVPAVSGSRHDWTISGGAFTTAMPTDNVVYNVSVSAGGVVTLNCTETNAAGTVASCNTKSLNVVAAPGTPAITAGFNGNVTVGTTGNSASVPAASGMTHAWSIGGTGASITSATSGDSVAFTAASSGNTTLNCTEANQANVSASCAAKTLTGVAAPGTPSITAGSGAGNAFVTTGAAGLAASVPAVSGSTHSWNITGGSISTAMPADSISYSVSASAGGTVTLSCTETNAAGTVASCNGKSLSVVAAPGNPVISAGVNGNVTLASTGNSASVPAATGMTHGWTISGTGASITSSTTGDSIAFTAASSGNTTLNCTETNQANVSGNPASKVLTGAPLPATPRITAPSVVDAGATGLTATVGANSGMTYLWSITQGTSTGNSITSSTSGVTASGVNTVSFSSGTTGFFSLSAQESNAAGATSALAVRGVTAVSCPVTLAAGQTNPAGIAVDASNVYWVNSGTVTGYGSGTGDGAVMKVPIGGGTPTALFSGQAYPQGIAVDSTNVYWSNNGTLNTKGSINKAALSGGGSTPIWTSSTLNTTGNDYGPKGFMTVDATNVYAIIQNGCCGADVDEVLIASPFTVIMRESRSGSTQAQLNIDANNIYWTVNNGFVLQGGKAGGSVGTVASGLSGTINGVAVDATSVYWVDYGSGTVSKAPIGGGTVAPIASGQSSPVFIAVDPSSVYWTNNAGGAAGAGSVMKAPIGGGTAVTLAAGLTNPSYLALDSNNVYWTNLSSSGSVMKVSKSPSCPTSFTATGAMAAKRDFSSDFSDQAHGAALLQNGKVLAVAGSNSTVTPGYLGTAELYDPTSGAWSAAGSMTVLRHQFSIGLLSNGKVIAGGGQDNSNALLSSSDVYDPSSNAWSSGPMLSLGVRSEGSAAVLANGKLLIADGLVSSADCTYRSDAELFDPAASGGAGSWSSTGSLHQNRSYATSALLTSGKVLLAGGPANGCPSNNLGQSQAETYDPSGGTWTVTGQMSSPRYGNTMTALGNGKAVLAGGFGNGIYLAAADLFDPSGGGAGTFSVTGSLATPRTGHSSTLLPSGRMVVIGGNTSSGSCIGSAEIYDPATGLWTTSLASLITPRTSHVATLLPNGQVLIAGGQDCGGHQLSSAEIFDENPFGVWTTKQPMSGGRWGTAAGVVNNKLYVLGGANAQFTCSYLATNEVYDPAANAWTTKMSMPTAREGLGVAVVSNILYAMGGGTGCGSYTSVVEAYDPTMDSWTTKSPMPQVSAGPVCVAVSGMIYCFGANNGGTPVPVFAYNPSGDSWATKSSMPVWRSNVGVAAVNGTIYVMGGNPLSGPVSTEVDAYDPVGDSWTTKAPLPLARGGGLSAQAVNGVIFLFGGGDTSGAFVAEVDAYDVASNTWRRVADLPTKRSNLASGQINGIIYAVGGSSGTPTIYATDEALLP